ncbi:PREDICTED: E3 ubiquitin-protein ligase Os04g0590900 [Nelumbo nucifera]|uniref:RING-type E3 ubiquitin transferase n=2 Tax=Nelumbo nucifera TaxID=4432 RepID=A0A822XJQ2_NELNU|nr:PREDICTED: E3 ubiquitin-protein ligase Os04g0590900 [Nelumbo nucifera]DAD17808.1 TPA_asm: hypothetical protein HUJ06_019271 [Nelumbo nucifera]
MGSVGSPQTWVPYQNDKDCSLGFCSFYCPQWCFIVYPPPPPFGFSDEESSSPSFSPLVIAIIGILASALLLVSYYTLISKYCGNLDSLRRRGNDHDPNEEFDDTRNLNHEQWQVSTGGLDEALIKSITVCKYKRGDGLIDGADCSVCLSEFQEDESLRLLPKCSHAFHVTCIDTWLKSHSNCPLCRANIVSPNPLPLQSLPPVPETRPENVSSIERRQENTTVTVVAVEDTEWDSGEETTQDGQAAPKTPLRAMSDLGDAQQRDTIIEIRDEGFQKIRRSVSMDSSCQGRLSIADMLCMSQDEDSQEEDNQLPAEVGSSKQSWGEHSKSNSKNRVLLCITSPIAMKRSFSSGRFMLTRHGRGKDSIISM